LGNVIVRDVRWEKDTTNDHGKRRSRGGGGGAPRKGKTNFWGGQRMPKSLGSGLGVTCEPIASRKKRSQKTLNYNLFAPTNPRTGPRQSEVGSYNKPAIAKRESYREITSFWVWRSSPYPSNEKRQQGGIVPRNTQTPEKFTRPICSPVEQKQPKKPPR